MRQIFIPVFMSSHKSITIDHMALLLFFTAGLQQQITVNAKKFYDKGNYTSTFHSTMNDDTKCDNQQARKRV